MATGWTWFWAIIAIIFFILFVLFLILLLITNTNLAKAENTSYITTFTTPTYDSITYPSFSACTTGCTGVTPCCEPTADYELSLAYLGVSLSMSAINISESKEAFLPSYLEYDPASIPDKRILIASNNDSRIYGLSAVYAFGDTPNYISLNNDGPWEQVAFGQYGLVMKPLIDQYNNVYPSIKQNVTDKFNKGLYQRLLVTGHGFGGGLAQLIALSLAVDFPEITIVNYTTGVPHIGDYNIEVNLADIVTTRWQTINTSDNIVYYPYPVMNASSSRMYGYAIFPPNHTAFYRYQTLNVSDNHDPINYQYAISGAGTPPFTPEWPIAYPQLLCN